MKRFILRSRVFCSRALCLSVVCVSALALSACSRAPSQEQIDQAYRQEVDQTNQMTARFGGKALAIQVNEVKKIDCTAREIEGQYRCKVEIDSTLPIIGQRRQMTEITLSKGEKNWQIVRGIASE